MCTAVTFQSKDHYFGRNLDLEYSYRETVTVTARGFPLPFRCKDTMHAHCAIIGMAMVEDDYPLYYDATNEYGLSMAGLNFPGNAVYREVDESLDNITPFELIPWILGQCKSVDEAMPLLQRLNLADISFSQRYPLSPLHWILADQKRSVTIEPLKGGIKLYENPVGILTNNPPFDYHLHNLANYLNLTREEPSNRFAPAIEISPYSRGMGAMGLPGDLSSASRFVRAAFTKLNSVCEDSESAHISQFFHILGSVAQQDGCAKVANGYERTVYSSCCNVDKGIYYYTTYENSQITGVDMHKVDLNSSQLFIYPLVYGQQIRMEN